MARIVGLDQGDGPVEPGEQHVIDVLADGLDDRFTIAPNLQVVHRGGQVDDVDVLVIGPYGVIAIEVKNLAGQVIVSEREMYVDGHRRGNPYVQTNAKTRRIKSRIADQPQTRRVWVAPLVVLAREPRELRVPDDQRDFFVLADDVVAQLLDPNRWRGSDLSQDERQAVLNQLNLVARVRPENLSLGPYRIGQLESETNLERRYQATHTALGTEHEIVHIGYDPFHHVPDGGRSATMGAFREATALKEVGSHPNVRAATDLLKEPDGSVVLVLPPRTGESLREILGEGSVSEESAERILRDVISAVAHIHSGDVAHRRICPTTIEIDADGHAVLGGFGFAQIPGQEGATQHLSLGLPMEETSFVAPELFLRGTAGPDADLFSIGKLAAELGVTTLGGVSLEHLTESDPEERKPSIDELLDVQSEEDAPGEEGGFDGYQVLKRLSENTDGTTELAYNVVSGQQVVLRSYGGPQALDMARSVFRAMSASDHLGLERVNTMQQGQNETVCVVSGFVEGRSLAEAIDMDTLPDDRLDVLRRVAEAVEALHTMGWAHGDLTPANVILGDQGPIVIDFGIACPVSDVPHGGTPAYRPLPGWIRAETAVGLDLFGLGIVAHEVLHGSRPEITDDGLEVEADEPWSPAVAAVLGLAGAPECESVEDFVSLLNQATLEDELPIDSQMEIEIAEKTEPEDGLYRRVDELIIGGRLDEADELCPADWTNLRERIVRARGQQIPPTVDADEVSMVIGPVSLTAGPISRELLPVTISGDSDVRGTVSQFNARTDDVLTKLEVIEADNGETWITCVDVSGSPELYNAIVNRLRIGVRSLDDALATIDLALAVRSTDRWLTRSADGEAIRDATGLDVAEILPPGVEAEIGTRLELLDDASPRRGFLCSVFDERESIAVLVRAFVQLRIIAVLAASKAPTVAQSSPQVRKASPYPTILGFDTTVGFESSRAAIVRRLVEIADHEGPLNLKRLSRSFRVAAGAGRVTGARRAKLVAALEIANREGDLDLKGRASDDEAVVKTPEQSWMVMREAGGRSLEEIPLNELGAVIDRMASELPQLGSDALIDHVLREFYGRLRIHQSALQRLHRARVVGVDEAGEGGEYSALARYLVRQGGEIADNGS